MSTIWAFDHIENRHTLYCGKDCMKTFGTSFRKHLQNIIDFEKKKILWLTKEELKSYKEAKVYYICEKKNLNENSLKL